MPNEDLTDEVIEAAEADEPGMAEENVEAAVEEAAEPSEDAATADEGLGAEPQAPFEAQDQQASEASTEAEEA